MRKSCTLTRVRRMHTLLIGGPAVALAVLLGGCPGDLGGSSFLLQFFGVQPDPTAAQLSPNNATAFGLL